METGFWPNAPVPCLPREPRHRHQLSLCCASQSPATLSKLSCLAKRPFITTRSSVVRAAETASSVCVTASLIFGVAITGTIFCAGKRLFGGPPSTNPSSAIARTTQSALPAMMGVRKCNCRPCVKNAPSCGVPIRVATETMLTLDTTATHKPAAMTGTARAVQSPTGGQLTHDPPSLLIGLVKIMAHGAVESGQFVIVTFSLGIWCPQATFLINYHRSKVCCIKQPCH